MHHRIQVMKENKRDHVKTKHNNRRDFFWKVIVPTGLFILLAFDRLWVSEDAYITFRSVQNLWLGNGAVFNPGIRVESFSHPLWFLILCTVGFAGYEILPWASAILGVAFATCGLFLTILVGYKRTANASRILPIGLYVIIALPPFWDFASSGLETGLTLWWLGSLVYILYRLQIKPSSHHFYNMLIIGL